MVFQAAHSLPVWPFLRSFNIEPFVFASPDFKEFEEHFMGQHYTCCVVTWVEADLLGCLQFGVKEILDPMAVFEEFLGVGVVGNVHVVDEAERTD